MHTMCYSGIFNDFRKEPMKYPSGKDVVKIIVNKKHNFNLFMNKKGDQEWLKLAIYPGSFTPQPVGNHVNDILTKTSKETLLMSTELTKLDDQVRMSDLSITLSVVKKLPKADQPCFEVQKRNRQDCIFNYVANKTSGQINCSIFDGNLYWNNLVNLPLCDSRQKRKV